MLAVGWALIQGCEPGTLVFLVSLSLELLGLLHSMVTGFNQQAPQEDHGEVVYGLVSKDTEYHFCHS